MLKITRVLAAVAVAGVATVGGSAYTAANTVPQTGIEGYGQDVVTGATISTIFYSALTADQSKLDTVVFNDTTTDDFTGKDATMTLKMGTTVVGTYTCAFAGTAPTQTITCDTGTAATGTANPLIDTFDTTGLTVLTTH